MSILTPARGLPAFRPFRASLPLGAWLQVAHERRQLAGMTAQDLRDLGIDPAAAAREAARPFWDLPKGRR